MRQPTLVYMVRLWFPVMCWLSNSCKFQARSWLGRYSYEVLYKSWATFQIYFRKQTDGMRDFHETTTIGEYSEVPFSGMCVNLVIRANFVTVYGLDLIPTRFYKSHG